MCALLGLSVYGGVGAESGVSVWVALELNLLGFLGVLMSGQETKGLAPMKYFLVQGAGSAMVLLGLLATFGGGAFPLLIVQAGLLLKLGAAPFHGWLVGLGAELSWDTLVLILSIQKVLPLFVSLALLSGMTLSLVVVVGVSVGVLGSLGQSAWKSLLVYSSVFGLGWMVICGGQFWAAMVYLLLYSSAVLVVSASALSGAEGSAQMMSAFMVSGVGGAGVFLGFFSMGGLPPFIGFFGKVCVIGATVGEGDLTVLVFLVVCSIWMLYLYTKLFFRSSLKGEAAALVFSTVSQPWAPVFFLISASVWASLCLWVGVSTLSFELKGNN